MRSRFVTTLVLVACSTAHKESSPRGTKTAGSSDSRLPDVPDFVPAEAETPINISVFEALGNTERYAGKRVQLAGVFGKELRGIFATREHAQLNLPEYGVALSAEACDSSKSMSWSFSDLEASDGEYVRVEAKLSTKIRGEHGIFRLGLCDVTKIAKAGFLTSDVVDARSRGASRPKGSEGRPQ
jgi:hypothetical protein